ncbi:MAG: ribonuclease III [Rhodospirillales bacterium]|nr:ribonuclease III [Rhodospirillales bacterium]MCB9997299.1 ribonuclease III [Rhodospirillales bacterium]
MSNDALRELQDSLDYHFKQTELLERALTHSSTGAAKNYERLEFLGDRVVGLVMAHMLWETFPKESEGDLAKRHAALVQGKMLAKLARLIKLGDAMQLSDAERAAGGSSNENILADGLESVIGAMYVDGGLEDCERVIKRLWGNSIHIMKAPPQDPKTALQEWAQGRALPLPSYELVGKAGPDHAPTFEVKVTVEGYPPWTSEGKSRRKAEKDAAAMLLAHLIEMES